MSIELQQIVALVLVAGLMLALNLKAGYWWLELFTFVTGIAALGGAVWLTVQWVFLA